MLIIEIQNLVYSMLNVCLSLAQLFLVIFLSLPFVQGMLTLYHCTINMSFSCLRRAFGFFVLEQY